MPFTLDDLIAVNDEIVALTRSGVPLERSLKSAAGDIKGATGKVLSRIADKLAAGQPMEKVLAEEQGGIPPMYLTLIEVGWRTGHPAAALEGLTVAARRINDLRRFIGLSLLYPLVVVLFAYGMFVLYVGQVAPVIHDSFFELRLRDDSLARGLAAIGPHLVKWSWVFPAVVVAVGLAWWTSTRRAMFIQPKRFEMQVSWIPWVGKMIRWGHVAAFSELMVLLVRYQVPLHRALELAATATLSPGVAGRTLALGRRIELGEPLTAGEINRTGLPPLLCWLIVSGARTGNLERSLAHAAWTYHERALAHAELMRVVLPVLVTAVVGGSATGLYAVSLIAPFARLLREIGLP